MSLNFSIAAMAGASKGGGCGQLLILDSHRLLEIETLRLALYLYGDLAIE
jgi:hypothetical protein